MLSPQLGPTHKLHVMGEGGEGERGDRLPV